MIQIMNMMILNKSKCMRPYKGMQLMQSDERKMTYFSLEHFIKTSDVHYEEWKTQNYANYAKHSQIHERNE
jgi:hypothetical protein